MKILKPNEIGKGILIEYDAGHISMKNAVDNDFVNEQKSQLDHSKPFVFYAKLQKYGTPNRNGRVYPENILKREAEKYKQTISTAL